MHVIIDHLAIIKIYSHVVDFVSHRLLFAAIGLLAQLPQASTLCGPSPFHIIQQPRWNENGVQVGLAGVESESLKQGAR